MSENLMEANRHWATRNPDDRFWDATEFEEVMRDRESRRAEVEVTINNVRFHPESDSDISVEISTPSGTVSSKMNNLSFRQFANRLGYPTGGLDPELISNTLICNILNYRVSNSDPEMIVKFLLESNDDGSATIKSVTSDAYARLNNSACVPFLRRLESFGFRLPPARPAGMINERTRIATQTDVLRNNRVGGGAVVNVGDLIAPAGLYCGDEDFFAFYVADGDENLVDDGEGNSLMQGIMMRNSDVGVGSFKCSAFVMEGVCGNHIIWGVKDIVDITYRHIGDAVNRIHTAMHALTPQNNKEYLDELRLIMMWMNNTKLGSGAEEVVDNVRSMLKNKYPVMTEKLLYAAYINAAQWRDQDGAPDTYGGFMRAITRYSQTVPFQNVRKEIDKGAGALIEIAKNMMGK